MPFRHGYCQCAWRSWCAHHNRDCWACAAAWSAGFAQGEYTATASFAQELETFQECHAQWEADLNQAEAAAAAAAAQEEARAEKKAAKKAEKKAKKKSKAEGSRGGQAAKKSKASGSDGCNADKKSEADVIG